jgi:hypothetical protein
MATDPSPAGGHRPPGHQLAIWLVLGGAFVTVVGLASIRTDHGPDHTRAYPPRALPADEEPELLAWKPRDDEYFPCSDCHEDEPTNRTRRQLEDEHEDLKLEHGDLWCLSCHDADHRDQLHLSDGTLIGFEDSWKLCTQCHGAKLADWRAGVHGKRTGNWRGAKQYRTCVVCHDPHSPPFQPLEPKPPPRQAQPAPRAAGVISDLLRGGSPDVEP